MPLRVISCLIRPRLRGQNCKLYKERIDLIDQILKGKEGRGTSIITTKEEKEERRKKEGKKKKRKQGKSREENYPSRKV